MTVTEIDPDVYDLERAKARGIHVLYAFNWTHCVIRHKPMGVYQIIAIGTTREAAIAAARLLSL